MEYQDIRNLYEKAVKDVAKNPESWQDFLSSACKNYKLRFDEQILIYAQAPDAEAIAKMEVWNRTYRRWVKKNAKGITVFDDGNKAGGLAIYFDIKDTMESVTGSRKVHIWQMQKAFEEDIAESLSNSFGETVKGTFSNILLRTAANAAEDNIADYFTELKAVREGSLLEELDELNLEVSFRKLAENSIAFMLLKRCGIDTDKYFDREDFAAICDFNTEDTINAVGSAVSDISGSVLKEISKAIRDIQKNGVRTFASRKIHEYYEEKTERSKTYEQYSLSQRGRLPYTEPAPADTGNPAWQIRIDAQSIPERTQESNLHEPADQRQTQFISQGGGGAGAVNAEEYNGENGGSGGSKREIKIRKSDEVGADDEQLQKSGRGTDYEGTDLQLDDSADSAKVEEEAEQEANESRLPTVKEQKEIIETEAEDKTSAFSFSAEEIDAVLTRGSNLWGGKYRIYERLKESDDIKANIEFLKKEYGTGGYSYTYLNGDNGFINYDSKGIKFAHGVYGKDKELTLRWNKAEQRIRELVREDRYLNEKDKERYPAYLAYIAERKEKSRKWEFINETGKLPLSEKRESMPVRLSYFMEVLERYEKNFMDKIGRHDLLDADVIDFEKALTEPESVNALADFMHLVKMGTTDAITRNSAYKFKEELLNLLPLKYVYKKGDKVYIGADKYLIDGLTESTVRLYNIELPLLGKELSIEAFEQQLSINPANDYLKKVDTNKSLAAVEMPATSQEEAADIPKQEQEQQEPKENKPDEKIVTKPVAEYPAEKTGLAYDITLKTIATAPNPQEAQKMAERTKANQAEQTAPEAFVSDKDERINYHITDDSLGVGSTKEKLKRNIAAIDLLHELESKGRLATKEEQEILSKYVGWGGLSKAFDREEPAWSDEYAALKMKLSDSEYQSAMESTLTAFYTPPAIIRAMYDIAGRLGYREGNILDPACGIGNFFGMLPETMSKSRLHGVEIDSISGRIAKQLYQNANIEVKGFEETEIPNGYFDVVIGNVPFGDFKVNDPEYNANNFLIHDYFLAKALDKVRAGGIVMFITSKGTMDKANSSVRKYIAQRAELLGAIRLPDNTFKANAGTEVTSDILILQKRDRIIETEPDWINIEKDENGMEMNSYFVRHPDMILGKVVMESSRFGMQQVCKAHEGIPLSELLSEAVSKIDGSITESDEATYEISDESAGNIPADPDVRNFSFTLVDGKIYFRNDAVMEPAEVSQTAESRIKGLIRLRDCMRKLIKYQSEDYSEQMIIAERGNLNRLYDDFVSKYGHINSRGNYLAFASDESYFLLCSLEILDDNGNFKAKSDMFTKRTVRAKVEITEAESAVDALAVSIGEKAKVDISYMQKLTGKGKDEILRELHGIIFRLPNIEPERYVTADEYLSGNIREKLMVAEIAAKENLEFEYHVKALNEVMPKELSAAEITVRLGTTWIPKEDIQDFMVELLKTPWRLRDRIRVQYNKFSGEWFIENKSADYGNIKATNTYGTKRASAYKIIEDTLNLRDVRIFDYVYDEGGNKKAVFNAKETMAAQGKQEQIKEVFNSWIWKDIDRRNRLVRYYNDTFNSTRARQYDGSHIRFSGMNPEITLKPHQVNAIARILYGGNTLLAHKVGAGKTFEMVAAAQESKRLGLCSKSMFVVPNHLVGQWASEYLRLYPAANILVTRKQDFEKSKRKKFCSRIATGDYDAVIIGHSQFEKIPISDKRHKAMLERQLDDIERGIEEIKEANGERYTVKQLMKTRKSIMNNLKKLNDTSRKDSVIYFEELGVDRLFVDEAHGYKNLFLQTKMRNVAGISQTDAQKSSDLFMKCRYLDEITESKGIIFATGTPISNSMVVRP